MSPDASIYFLNSGSAEPEPVRLDKQHHNWVDMMGNDLLPPDVRASLSASSSPPRIVEIATGTAIWLSEVAKTLSPNAELVGLDFDTSKFPSASCLASNIVLRPADMFMPFPSDLLGMFDVVNVRLIIFALKEGSGVDLASNLMTLLKSRGYLVWSETGPVTNLEPPSAAWFKFQDITWRFAKRVGTDVNLPIGMKQHLEQAGCVECEDRAYPASSQLYTEKRADWTPRMNVYIREFSAQTITGIVEHGGVDGMSTEEEAAEFIALCREEFVDRKVHLFLIRAWGKKPEGGVEGDCAPSAKVSS
ncbi:S-adenosyl-L-methionine-dependent methyltransferase [Astrocystis sublimbata]|nr:S-adenosyl-L-methionine-dependent methyltransferase [Astrocystis sublimbata]